MKNTYVIPNTKGGAGKSTFSTMILPVLLPKNKKINIFEIDNNNQTKLTNSSLNFKNITVKESEEALDAVHFDLLTSSEDINIIDCGGGDDTLSVLNHFKLSEMSGLTYFIPTNDDIEQFDNVAQTIKAIKAADNKAIINLVFNRVALLDKKNVEEQFVGFFGSKNYGIKSRLKEIEDDINDTFFIPNSNLFGILKNIYQVALVDSYIQSQDIVDNIKEYQKKWTEQGVEVFKKKQNLYRFAKSIIQLVENIKPIQKAL